LPWIDLSENGKVFTIFLFELRNEGVIIDNSSLAYFSLPTFIAINGSNAILLPKMFPILT